MLIRKNCWINFKKNDTLKTLKKLKMKITFVMSVFNGGIYLDHALKSILNQTYKDFDFIIINNGSTDQTESILSHYEKVDNRVKIVKNNKNIPLEKARHQGILQANTEWVALCDADDYSHPQRLERQIKFIKKMGSTLGALGTYAYYINEKNEKIGVVKTGPTTEDEFKYLLTHNEAIVIADPSAMIHRQSYIDVGGYRAEYSPAADLDLNYRLCEYGKQVRTLPEFLLEYRIAPSSVSSSKTMLQRIKIHFINHNMRRRRKNLREITYSEFQSFIKKKPFKRLKWFRKDHGMAYYRRAGIFFGQRNYAAVLFYLGITLILNPRYLFSKVFPQIKYFFREWIKKN